MIGRQHFADIQRLEDEEDDDQTSGITEVPDITQHRLIYISREQPHKFCTNRISTAKYNFFSFVPKFLFEQFRRYSNVFFLFIALLQQIPNVSPTGRYTTAVPLLFILAVSAIKEIIEDFKRHRADGVVNNRRVLALHDGVLKLIKWTEITVGTIIKVTNSNFFPADLVLLASSEPQGICYIETANLDGETNLKIRQGLSETASLLTTEDLMTLNTGTVECELPNKHLYEFTGNIKPLSRQAYPLGPDQILLRGAKLRNTNWVFGIVIYTGHETKLMMNSTTAPLKRSTIDKLTNTQILLLFVLLIIICLISSVASELWIDAHLRSDWYLGLDELSASNFGYNFLTFIILYNNLIPISLQVTLEVVRFIQAIFINMDVDMYHEPSDTPAMARTSNLNEELGQVKYVFSDKTGTLTRNVMEFKMCSIAGIKYGDNVEGSESFETMQENLVQRQPSAPFIKEFLTLMAVCHTVVPERSQGNNGHENGEAGTNGIRYLGASPDEGALVRAAKRLGFVFTTRTPQYVIVESMGREEKFEILNVLEFTSTRKRMSVIVRTPQGKIKLYCKGADSVLYERLGDNQQYRDVTLKHLEEFATDGLRTLCCAVSEIPEEFYEEWKNTYYKASTTMQYRDRKIEEAAQLIETNLTLLGSTAIEDKLQEGVPESIASLLKADIKVWILTGDKQETAINIGYSCKLLHQGIPMIMLSGESLDNTREALRSSITTLGSQFKKENDIGLVVDGKTLTFALSSELRQDFADVALSCKSVICCRVSPIQKAEVVELIKNRTHSVTLAIGDGANDVAMIQSAHVGIGISGVEGMQASCASDYSIAQFRYLNKLLFVHGAWSYHRMSKLILYSFHKNICLYVIELWFAIVSGWSGQTLFERWTIGLYNVIFTAAPPFALGLFDRICSSETMMKYPDLYKSSQGAKLFNVRVFWVWIINAIFHSVLLFWLTYSAMTQDVAWSHGKTGGYLVLGNMVYTYTVITVCIKAGLVINAWTWITHLAIWGSIFSWFVFLAAYSNFWPSIPVAPDMVGMAGQVFSSMIFWTGLLVIPFISLLPDLCITVARRSIWKTWEETVRESELKNEEPPRVDPTPSKRLTETARLLKNVKSAFKRPSRMPLEVEMRQMISTMLAKPTKLFANCSKSKIFSFKRFSETSSVWRPTPYGYAFSQEEHGAVSQTEVIRAYDSTKSKPKGL